MKYDRYVQVWRGAEQLDLMEGYDGLNRNGRHNGSGVDELDRGKLYQDVTMSIHDREGKRQIFSLKWSGNNNVAKSLELHPKYKFDQLL